MRNNLGVPKLPLHKQEAPYDLWEHVLHLIDAENLGRGPRVAVADAAHIQRAYDAVAPHGVIDQLVVATSHHAAKSYWFAWPCAARRLVRSGPDGADLELLAVLANEDVAARFDRVVIGSGDGIFAIGAAELQAAGCAVTVVTRSGALSRQLAFAVRDVRFLIKHSARPAVRIAA